MPVATSAAAAARLEVARLLGRIEAGGDDGHLDLVAHPVVDDRAEDDVRLRIGGLLDHLGGLVDLEQAEVASRRSR